MNNESGITPTGNHVLVKPVPKPEKTSGGIFVPEEARQSRVNAQVYAHVVEIGPDSWSDMKGPWAAVGDKVIIAKYAGTKLFGADAGTEYRVINDLDITAIVAPGVKMPGEEEYE